MRIATVLVAAATSAACASSAPPPPPTPRHLLLVTIDTLRADRLGCYGNPAVSTPNIDRLAREGARAADASVHVPLTRPSHVSLLTGLYPAQHGIRDNVSPSLRVDVPTLAEILRSSGFRTAAFVSSVVLSAQSGLNRGFETYWDRFDGGRDDVRFLDTLQRRGDETMAQAIAWLRSHHAERTATWVHLYDPHDPYEPPEPYATRYADRPYDGDVAWSDELIGRLIATVDELGLRDDTLVVVTSDHGEGLEEHGEPVHGYFVYESTLRVPLIFRGPGIHPGRTLQTTVRTVDVMPTLLNLLRVSRPAGWRTSGRSLADALRGEIADEEVPTYAESLVPRLHFGWSELRTLRAGRWKFILAPKPELYDLQQDPNELMNLADAQSARVRALRAGLDRHLDEERRQPNEARAAAMSPELRERLAALGYVSSGRGTSAASTTIDPKDKIEEYTLITRSIRDGMTRLRDGDFRGSARQWRALHERGVDTFEVNYYLGRALAAMRQHVQAALHLARAIELMPEYVPAYLALAESYVGLRDWQSALTALEAGRRFNTKNPRLYDLEGDILRRLGRRPAAIRAYETVVALAPTDALARVRLGELYRDGGDVERAVRLLREAVEIEPTNSAYWNSLGMVLGGDGRLHEAEVAFRSAWQRSPSDAFYAYNLGLALQRLGRAGEAEGYFRKALQLDPRFADARRRLSEVRAR